MNRLKQIRERKSLTLAQVSARTSIPLRMLTDYEENLQEIPPQHLKVLSKALWVKPDELLLPAGMAPAAAAPAPGAPAPVHQAAAVAAPVATAASTGVSVPGAPPMATGPAPYGAPRPYPPAPAYGALRPPRPAGAPLGETGRGARPPARPRREPVVMPATDGQITEIMRLAARLNMSTEEIETQFGRSMDNITRFDAREWIKKLREDAIAKAPPAKVHFGQWPGLKDDREAVYLAEQRDLRAPFRVTLFNGEVFTGYVVDFTPYTITLKLGDDAGNGGAPIVLRKLAIAYYQSIGPGQPADGSSAAAGEGQEIAPFPGSGAPTFAVPAEEGGPG